MTLVEKLKIIVQYGQYSWAMDRTHPVQLYWYKYHNRDNDPLNEKMVFDLSIPGAHGAAEFHGETLEEAADKALVFLLRRRREHTAEVREEATRKEKLAAGLEMDLQEFERALAKGGGE